MFALCTAREAGASALTKIRFRSRNPTCVITWLVPSWKHSRGLRKPLGQTGAPGDGLFHLEFDPGSSWGLQSGPNPTDRAKLGSKRHLICDGRGVPLAIQLTGANRNDSQQALSLVDAIPTLQGEPGRPRHRPDRVLGDRGYDAQSIRQGLRDRRISLSLRSATPNMAADWGAGAG